MKDMPKSAIRWYKMWIGAYPESWDESDLERFYMFVSVLLTYSKKERSRYWLKENLKEDCPKLTDDDIEKYCYIYEHLKGFKNVWKSRQARLIAISMHEEHMEEVRKKYRK
jgi:hypothetical protein